MTRTALILPAVLFIWACTRTPEEPPAGSAGQTSQPASGGTSASGSGSGGTASGGSLEEPIPRYHPPPGFGDCTHAEVKANCTDGWCKLPPSCFVMGSPEDEWHRGLNDEVQVAVTLTSATELQQEELSRTEWEAITDTPAPGPSNCTEPECPVAMVSWWDAVHAANLLSEQKGLAPCYEPVGCTGTLGADLECTGVADPDASVYECEGYRLPTRAEAEYAARAGTISTFYSGDIRIYDDSGPGIECEIDPALELIAWYCFNSSGRPHEGGKLQSNSFGLYDILGNVSEWLNEGQHYSSSPGGENPRGLIGTWDRRMTFSPQYDGPNHFLRPASLLSSQRNGRGQTIGFRLIRTLPD